MKADPIHRLEAWALILGPALALLFFLLEPGGLLIDPASATDAAGKITALASNAALSHVAGFLIPLGLILMLYGFHGVNRATVQNDAAAAVSRFGVLCITVGGAGWILADGPNHILAQTSIGSGAAIDAAIPLYQTGAGIVIVSSMAVALGLMAVSASLATREPRGFHRTAALIISGVSLIALLAFVIGYSIPSDSLITIGRICYFFWVIWFITLGVKYLKAGDSSRANAA